MYISKLELTNFRNFKNGNFEFKPGVNTLIGENSSGKSNALDALRLLLDDNLPFNASKLLEKDFNQTVANWKGHWIVLKLTFKNLDSSEAASFISHYAEDVTAGESIGTYALLFRPNKVVRKKLFQFTEREEEDHELEELLSSITIHDYETVFTSRLSADFNNEQIYKRLVGDFELGYFPNPEEDDTQLLGNISPHITMIRREISCTYVKALRNVMSELKLKKSSPLLKLLRGTAKDIEISEANEITEQVKELNKNISELHEIDSLTHDIKDTLNRTLGYTYSPNVNIKSELPEEIESLLHSLTLWVGDDTNSIQGKLEDLSLGGANLIYITLKLLEYEFYQSQDEKAAHFLLIEEPEAHIHTHIQKTLFDNYQFKNTQVIITTHSTHISSASKIDTVNILIKEDRFTKVCKPSKGLEKEQYKRIERYLDATRSTLLFAKGVILVEGDAELILIPALFKAAFGLSLDEIGVSVINMSSTVFENIALLFDEERIHRKCAIITDFDKAIESLPANVEEDNPEQKKMRDSQTAGENRARNLNAVYEKNPWVNVFYAPHTFEIDFSIIGNEQDVIDTLPKIYARNYDIVESTKKLTSKDETIIGKETLRLAVKTGKGWFALLLSEEISSATLIPEYILKAIAFTSQHITEQHLKAMAKYRIVNNNYGEEDTTLLDELELDALLEIIREFDEDDNLIILINFLKEEL